MDCEKNIEGHSVESAGSGRNHYEIADIIPMFPYQKHIFAHASYLGDSYPLPQFSLEYDEAFDLDAYQQAWRLASTKFPALRIAFSENKKNSQIIAKAASIDASNFEHKDIRAFHEDAQENALREIAKEARTTGFDVRVPGLIRFTIISHGESSHTILATYHPAIFDRESIPLLVDTVNAFYASIMANETPSVIEDGGYYQVHTYSRQEQARVNAFWDRITHSFEHANDLNVLLNQPTDLTCAGPNQVSSSEALNIHGEQLTAVHQLCQYRHVSVNAVLQFIWHKIVHVYTRDDQTIVGSTVSTRSHPIEGVENSVGAYSHELPVLVDWQAEASISSVLTSIEQSLNQLELCVHSNPVEVIEAGERLFLSALKFETVSEKTNKPNSAESTQNGIAHLALPLSLTATLSHETLIITLAYGREYLSNSDANRLLAQFSQILDFVTLSPEQAHVNIPLVREQERNTQLNLWNQTQANYPLTHSVHQLFEQQVLRSPESTALVFEGRELTYQALNEKVNQLAYLIREHYADTYGQTIKPDTLITLYFDRGLQMVISILAVLKAGGAYVPISPEHPREYVEFLLQDTQSALLLSESKYADSLDQLLSPLAAPVQLLISDNPELTEHLPVHNPEPVSYSSDLAYLIFTSGTTGNPKGAMVEHSSLVNLVCGLAETYGFSTNERVLWWPSYIFDGSVELLFITLLNGARLIIPTTEDINAPEQIKTLIHQQRVSHLAATPTYLSMLGRSDYANSLRRVISAGEQCSQELKDTWQDLLVNVYGPTETTAVSVLSLDVGTAKEVNRIGRPVHNAKLYVLDEQLNLLPTGAVGELYIGGAGVSRGYWNRPELTGERFIDNPYASESDKKNGYERIYKTGDLVRWLDDGNIEYVGRNDFQVKIRGYRIELGEIEHALSSRDDVKQAAVLAKKQGNSSYLAAYIVSAQQALPLTEEISEYLAARLPEYMVPVSYTFIESLPMTINGKLDWRVLPEPVLAQSAVYRAPRNEQEQVISRIWQDVLGIERVGIEDNFFRIGGDSLSGIRIAAAVQGELGIEFPLSALFDNKTIARISENMDLRPAIVIPQAEEGARALSFAQDSMFFIDQFENGSQAYHVPHLMLLSADVDLDALATAINQLVSRHDVLRTLYKINDANRVSQHVLESHRITLDFQQCTDDKVMWPLVQRDVNQAFDLSNEPSIRLSGYQTGQRQFLLFVWHHIASDGWSTDLFMRELGIAYQAAVSGTPAALAELPLRYIDYASWQRDYLQGDVLKSLSSYWKNTLSHYDNLELPLDHPRAKRFDYRGADFAFELDLALSGQLRSLAKHQETSMYNLLLSGFYVMLSSVSGQTDIVIGSPTDNRQREQTHGLMGLFVNSLPLRLALEPAQDVTSLIDLVHRVVSQAKTHQDLPFEKLVSLLDVKRDTSRHPVFQVMFNVHHFVDEDSCVQLPFSPMALPQGMSTAQFDINLSMNDSKPCIAGNFNYALSLLQPKTVERMVLMYKRVLQAFVDSQSQAIGDIRVLSDEERLDLLALTDRFHSVDIPETIRLNHLLELQVDISPDKTAVEFEDQSLTYEQLNQRANQVARYLIEQDSADLVGLYMDRSLEMVIAIWGILKAGKAYVPLDPCYPQARTRYMLENAGINLVLTQVKYASSLDFADPVITSLDHDDTVHMLGSHSTDNLCLDDAALQRQPLAYIIYTSGSTGEPKGVMVGHRAVVNRVDWMQSEYQLTAKDVVLQKTPYSFDVSVWEFIWPLVSGARLVVAKPDGHKDPAYLLALICRAQVTSLHFVPSMLQAMLTHGGLENCHSIRQVFCSGEVLPLTLQTQFFESGTQSKLHNLYGPTEAAIDVSYWECDANSGLSTVPIGKPIQNTRLLVLDKQLNPVPVGVTGELYIAGMGLAHGYLNQQELTDNSFIDAPFEEFKGEKLYKTGDLVRWLTNGKAELTDDPHPVLEYMGRRDQQVKIRGFRIELGEIEQQILSVSEVSSCAVVCWQDENNPQLTAYYTANEEQGSLSQSLRQVLPDYMVPSAFVHLDNIPLTPSGKINRKALPKPERPVVATYADAENDIQRQLLSIWRQVLGIERIGIEDNFFAIGGDSILSIQVVSLAQRAGLHFSVQELFDAQTVSALSERVSRDAEVVVSQKAVAGEQTLLPIQQRFLSGRHPEVDHHNQSMLLNLPGGLNEQQLTRVIAALVLRHDALRLSFTKQEQWAANYVDCDEHFIRRSLVCTRVSCADELSRLCRQTQSSLNLTDSLFRFVLAENADESKLFITVHHLIIDGISWRTLLADLDSLLQQLADGESGLTLPPKTHSLQDWATTLKNATDKGVFDSELAHWQREYTGSVAQLPVDHPHVDDQRLVNTQTVRFSLGEEQTQALLNHCHLAYHTKIDDLLLASVFLGLHRWCGAKSVKLDMEGHGRDTLSENLVLGDTLGWFTNLYPLTLSSDTPTDIKRVIESIKEQLRRVPANGAGFGALKYLSTAPNLLQEPAPEGAASSFIFNYLGQMDSMSANLKHLAVLSSIFEGLGHETDHPTKGEIGLENRRQYQLGVNALVLDGRLCVELDYNKLQYESATMACLAKDIEAGLCRVIEHCQSKTTASYTPSDIELADVSQGQLDDWQTAYPDLCDVYTTTSMQQGLLYHHQKGDAGGGYISQVWMQLNGPLDSVLFKQAWQQLINRHEAFRTAFSDDNLYQLILEQGDLAWYEENLAELSAAAQQQAFSEYQAKDKRLDFDFSRAPLVRLALFKLNPRQHVFMITHHHCILDGWSMSQVLSEMILFYRALATGEEKVLPAPVYKEYIHWLKSQDGEVAKAYWQKTLNSLQTSTPLSIDKIPEVRSQVGARELRWTMEDVDHKQLQEFARSHHTTLNIVIQGAWAYLLHRYSGEARVTFGAASSGRPADVHGIDSTVGLMVNSLPVVVDFEPGTPIRDWLNTLHKESVAREQHGYLSLVEIQKCSAIEDGSSLFDSLVGFQNYPVDEGIFGPPQGTTQDQIWIDDIFADEQTNYAITLMVEPMAELDFVISYRAEQFSADTIDSLARHLRQIITNMYSGEPSTIDDLCMLSANEQRQLLTRGNELGQVYPKQSSIAALFEEQVEQDSQAIAIHIGHASYSYDELNVRANQLAHYLLAAGVQKGDLIGLCLKPQFDTIVAMVAILKAGAAYVPLDPAYPVSRLSFMLSDSGIKALITESELLGNFEAKALPETLRIISLDVADTRDEIRRCPQHNLAGPGKVHEQNRLAYVIYTSGSTGQPKGTLVAQHNVIRLVRNTNYIELNKGSVVAMASNTSFDAATFEIWGALLNGGKLVHIPKTTLIDPGSLEKTLNQERVTTLFITTALFNLIAADRPQCFSNLEHLLFGGEAVSVEAVKTVLAKGKPANLLHVYGPTEGTTFSTWYPVTEQTLTTFTTVPIGYGLENAKLFVLDSRLRPQPEGVAGELYIGGDGVACGYLNQAELTAQSFISDPFDDVFPAGSGEALLYKTGDLVRRLSDGSLEFVGRADDQLKRRGFRIELGEIQATLSGLPEVQESVVLTQSGSDEQEKELVAYLVLNGQQADPNSHSEQDQLVDSWQDLYDNLYSHSISNGTFDITGWNSSFTGKAIPVEEMQEWQSQTVSRILALNPKRIYEIGCGTGLLLFRLLPECELYSGVDLSGAAIQLVQQQLTTRDIGNVKVWQGDAGDFSALADDAVDTVIINSVTQYFPNVHYLFDVILGAVKAMGDRGTVFVGDVVNYGLMETFHVAVSAFKLPATASLDELLQDASHNLNTDNELYISPDFFTSLMSACPDIVDVKIQLKTGFANNEMNDYRYDVSLIVDKRSGSEESAPELAEIEWQSQKHDLDWLEQLLRQTTNTEERAVCVVKNIPNSRLIAHNSLAELKLLASKQETAPTIQSLVDIRRLNAGLHPAGVDALLSRLAAAGECQWQHSQICWSSHGGAMHFDLWLYPAGQDVRYHQIQGISLVPQLSQFANDPSQAGVDRARANKVNERIEHLLPDYMCPGRYVVIEAMPLTPNGKIDKKALRLLDTGQQRTGALVAPQTQIEQKLCEIWQTLLAQDRIGVEDNFFELGGHSLLATRLISAIRRHWNVDIAIKMIFEAPTIGQLGQVIDQASQLFVPEIQAVNHNGQLPLSFSQQRLCFIDQLGNAKDQYNMPMAFKVSGEFSLEAIQHSINQVISRHSVLRTNLQIIDGQAYQLINPDNELTLEVVDLTHLSVSRQQSEVVRLQNEEATQLFDLAEDLKLRACVLKLGANEHVVLMTMHHIASDGWSMGVLLEEVSRLYEAYLEGDSNPLPELPIQYADYSYWQRTWFKGEILNKHREYWRNKLAGIPEVHQLPLDFPRPAAQSYQGDSLTLTLSRQVLAGLNDIASSQGASLFMVLHAAFSCFMYRYCDESDVVLGTPVAGREQEEVAGLIGFFVNNLVLRSDLSQVSTFEGLVQQSKNVLLEAYEHQQMPFEMLVEELKPTRSLSHNPLFQVVLSLQNMKKSDLGLSDLDVSPLSTSLSRVSYDLVLHIAEDEAGLSLRWEYATDLFTRTSIKRMADHFTDLLAEIVVNPALPISGLHIANWQQEHLGGCARERNLKYWTKQLAGLERLELPRNGHLSADNAAALQAHSFVLEQGISRQLAQLADKHEIKVDSLLTGGLFVTLASLSGQKDMLLAMADKVDVSQAEHSAQSSYLPLRLQLDTTQSISHLIEQLVQLVDTAKGHQEVAFNELIEDLGIEVDPSRHPLFEASIEFVAQSTQPNTELSKRWQQGEYDVTGEELVNRAADVRLLLEQRPSGIHGLLVYCEGSFAPETMHRIAIVYQRVMAGVVQQFEQPIESIDLLASTERNRLLNSWNQTDQPYPDDISVHRLFEQQVVRTPESIALTFAGVQLSYREVNEKANRLAHHIRSQYQIAHGVELNANTFISLYFDRSTEMLVSILAVLKAGAAYVPVSPDSPQERTRFMLEDTQAPIVLTQHHYLAQLQAHMQGSTQTPILIAADNPADQPGDNLDCDGDAADLAYVIYTSGTTGKPKGVMIEQRSVINHAYGLASRLGDAFSCVDFSTNYSFDLSVATNLCPLLVGGKIAIYGGDVIDTQSYQKHLRDNDVNLVKTTPSIAQATLLDTKLAGCSVLLGGEPLSPVLLDDLQQNFKQVFNEYGPTEATVGSTVIALSERERVSIGKAFPNVRLYCLSASLEPVGVGSPGELYIGGAGVARGYLNRPDLTAERFIDNPFASAQDRAAGYTRLYKTGDLVRWLPDGNIDYIARNDSQVKLRGFRIELGEIENVMAELTEVKQAVVIVHESKGNKQLAAYLVPDNAVTLELDQVRSSLEASLPDYMVPTTFSVLERIPLTLNGKVDRRALPDPEVQESDSYVAPREKLETQLCAIWQEVLGIEKVGVHDNFFRIGGESILSIQLVSRIRQEGFNLQVKDIFEAPTVAELAIILDETDEEAKTSTEQGLLTGQFDLLPIQQRFFEKRFTSAHHFNQAFMLCIPTSYRLGDIESAVTRLARQHDMLRCRFVLTETGCKQSYHADPGVFMKPVRVIDAGEMASGELRNALTQLQNDFDYEQGPLWQVALVKGLADGSTRLFFTFHHLIIDAVSCRIVADTMKKLLTGMSIPDKTSSYRQWSQAVSDYAKANVKEVSYWKGVASGQPEYPAPVAKHLAQVKLTAEVTDLLLHSSNQGYNTEINDLLLSGLAQALKTVFKRDQNHITLEGHGRETIDEQLDVSQTVGWFTTVYPVRLTAFDMPDETIIQTKEHLRKIPNKGLGFSALKWKGMLAGIELPVIGFNYLGQLDTSGNGSQLVDWQMTADECGVIIAEDNQDSLLLNIYGGVQNGVLLFDMISRLNPELTRVFTQAFEDELNRVIEQGVIQAKTGGIKTPSDFAAADLSIDNLRNVQKRLDTRDSEFQTVSSSQKNKIRI